MPIPAHGRRRLLAALVAVLTLAICGCSTPRPVPATPAGSPVIAQPRTLGTLAMVGPLFHNGLHNKHECTATVLAGFGGDLAITAAHCLTGTGAGLLFAPGYDDGTTPYGVWAVRRVFVDPAWVSAHDTGYDYAVLQLAAQTRGGSSITVGDLTGGARLGLAPPAGTTVTAVAYNGGSGDRPIQCRTRVYLTGPSPTFDCHGYVGGSSGSPWLTPARDASGWVVDGVIGGLHAGGCHDYTSYSAPFRFRVFLLVLRASLGLHPDTVPPPVSDGC